MDSGNLEVQEASSAWVFGDAGGKQWVSGGARGKLGVQKESSWYLEVQEAGCVCLEAQDSKKNLCDDPFQTVPGSIPGSCIPAFTGTLLNMQTCLPAISTTPKLPASTACKGCSEGTSAGAGLCQKLHACLPPSFTVSCRGCGC